MELYVPYDPDRPKSRLSDVLSVEEREELCRVMLVDVCRAVEDAGHSPVVLATRELEEHPGDRVRVAPQDLTPAVNDLLKDVSPPLGVLVADLPLADADAVERLAAGDADVSIAPGLAGGTSGFVVRREGFRVDYHGASYLDHLENARDAGLSVEEVDSFRLAVDVDRPEDLVEVLLHGDGEAAEYLGERFRLMEDDERRVGVQRTG